MPDVTDDFHRRANLRQRAILQMRGPGDRGATPLSGSAALGALHRLASSPATATEALSLLHELQVHQVELELQDEELRASRLELETLLRRQVQLYDHTPAGFFTIDQATVIVEVNLAGARLLGLDRNAVVGLRFDAFLSGNDRPRLADALALAADGPQADCELRLNRGSDAPKSVRVSAGRDPAGPRFILAAFEMAAARGG